MNIYTYIEKTYSATGEHLFAKDPATCVFRHGHNRKWFAVVMKIPNEKLGISGGGEIWVVNVKCDPRLIGSFRLENGIYPAYHMNKSHWLTVALDGTVDDDKMKFLIDMSYDLSSGKSNPDRF